MTKPELVLRLGLRIYVILKQTPGLSLTETV
jgi:hypothetical protein